MITLGSTELNYLIFRYLIEEGYTHSAYIFGKESMVEEHPNVPEVSQDSLKHYVTKGIEMEYIEKHTDSNNRIKKCAANYNITTPHKCVEQPFEISPTYLQSQSSDVSLCAWSESGELVTGSQNCLLRLWAPPAVSIEWELGHNTSTSHGITGLAIESGSSFGFSSPSTTIVGTTHTGDLFVAKGEKEWRKPHAHKGPIVAVSLNGQEVLTGGWDGMCKRWTVEGGVLTESQKWAIHKGPVMDILLYSTGFVTCSGDSTLCTVDNGYAVTKMFGHTEEVNCIKKVQDLIVSCSDDATIKMWRYGGTDPLHTLEGHKKEVYAIDTHGSMIASGSFDADVKIWDGDVGKETRTLTGHKKAIYSVAFSRDGALLASGGLDSSVCLWDTRSKELAKEFSIGSGIYQVAFSPKNNTLAVCSSDPRPILLDIRR